MNRNSCCVLTRLRDTTYNWSSKKLKIKETEKSMTELAAKRKLPKLARQSCFRWCDNTLDSDNHLDEF